MGETTMSKYELEKLIEKFNAIRTAYGINTKQDLNDLYHTNKELHATLMGMYLTLSYYCT